MMIFQPIRDVFNYIFELEPVSKLLYMWEAYGWFILIGVFVSIYLYWNLKSKWDEWRDTAWEKKNPDLHLSRMEAIQRARERQQEMWLINSARNAELEAKKEAERQEKKLRENEERLTNLEKSHGKRLGGSNDMPLSRGASSSNYRPPQRKCPGGGCGR